MGHSSTIDERHVRVDAPVSNSFKTSPWSGRMVAHLNNSPDFVHVPFAEIMAEQELRDVSGLLSVCVRMCVFSFSFSFSSLKPYSSPISNCSCSRYFEFLLLTHSVLRPDFGATRPPQAR